MAAQYFTCVDLAGPGSLWNTCIYTRILNTFESALTAGLTQGLIGASLDLLRLLGAMEVMVVVAWLAMRDDDQYITEMLCLLVRIGITAQLIANCLPWGLEFASGAINVGVLLGAPASLALGLPPLTTAQLRDPGGLMYAGFRLFTPLIRYIENLGIIEVVVWHSVTALLYGLVAIGGVICIVWIGLNIIVGWIELLLLLGFGTPMHAFSIFAYTRFLSMGILQTQAAAALRLGIHAACAALIFPLMSSMQVTDAGDPGWDTVFSLLGMTLICGYLSYRAYQLGSAITGGQSAYTGAGLVMLARQTSHVAEQISGVGSTMSTVARGIQGSLPARTARPS